MFLPDKPIAQDHPYYKWLMTKIQTLEMNEIKILWKTKRIKDLLLKGTHLDLTKAFRELCYLMNSKNTKSGEKWNHLAEDGHPMKWEKGRTLFSKLQQRQSDLFDEEERMRQDKDSSKIANVHNHMLRSKTRIDEVQIGENQVSIKIDKKDSIKNDKNSSIKNDKNSSIKKGKTDSVKNSKCNPENEQQKQMSSKQSSPHRVPRQVIGTSQWLQDSIHKVQSSSSHRQKESVRSSQKKIDLDSQNNYYDLNETQIIEQRQEQDESQEYEQELEQSSQEILFSQQDKQEHQQAFQMLQTELQGYNQCMKEGAQHKENYIQLVSSLQADLLQKIKSTNKLFNIEQFQTPTKRQRQQD